jgi:hypothetical protein
MNKLDPFSSEYSFEIVKYIKFSDYNLLNGYIREMEKPTVFVLVNGMIFINGSYTDSVEDFCNAYNIDHGYFFTKCEFNQTTDPLHWKPIELCLLPEDLKTDEIVWYYEFQKGTYFTLDEKYCLTSERNWKNYLHTRRRIGFKYNSFREISKKLKNPSDYLDGIICNTKCGKAITLREYKKLSHLLIFKSTTTS